MPKIRYYKAKKLKSGRTKIAGKKYRIVPLKDPKKYPKGTAILIPSKENNPVRKKRKKGKRRLSVKIRNGRKRIQIGGKKYRLTPVGKRTKKRGRKGLPPRDSKGRFRKRRKRR